jgi:hypothetical protein
MRKGMLRTLAVAGTLLLLAGGGWADEVEETEDSRPEPTHRIKVLQHPYDLASFYRSRQGPGFMASDEVDPRYPIAGFYRSRQAASPYGYSQFWNSGYGSRRSGVILGYRRSIGDNGDLFLLAPTFLAPLGPLSDAFFLQ